MVVNAWTRAALAGMALAVSGPAVQAQTRHNPARPAAPARTDETAVKVRLPTLADHLESLGGHLVDVSDLVIGEIVSPQAFTVEPRTTFDDPSRRRPARGLVLLTHRPERELLAGMEVQLLGRAYTLAGASVEVGWPDRVTPEGLEAFRGVPVIVADAVRTPGNVDLYRGRR